MLSDWPCFPNIARRQSPIDGYDWTHLAALLLVVGSALAAAYTAWRASAKLREVEDEKEGGHDDLAEIGHGRTRFVALWATWLGVSFAVVSLLTLVAFLMVPRCLG